jgi:hypothetical protein
VLALAATGAQVLVHCGYGIKEADRVVTEIRKARTVCGKAARTVVYGRVNETHVTPLLLRLPVLPHHEMLRRGR